MAVRAMAGRRSWEEAGTAADTEPLDSAARFKHDAVDEMAWVDEGGSRGPVTRGPQGP